MQRFRFSFFSITIKHLKINKNLGLEKRAETNYIIATLKEVVVVKRSLSFSQFKSL